jgi:hypothetical protein
MIPLAASGEITGASGVAPRIEAMLPIGVRPRQLTVRTLLAGMCLAQADHRPAHLTRVHQALVSLPEDDQRRLGVIADWKYGPHLLTCRQTERTFGLAADAAGKDEPDGLPCCWSSATSASSLPGTPAGRKRPPRRQRPAPQNPQAPPQGTHHARHRLRASLTAAHHAPPSRAPPPRGASTPEHARRAPNHEERRLQRPETRPTSGETTIPPRTSDPNVNIGLTQT